MRRGEYVAPQSTVVINFNHITCVCFLFNRLLLHCLNLIAHVFFPSVLLHLFYRSMRALSNPLDRGTVKSFSRSKGHGFITPITGGEDIFVHISEWVLSKEHFYGQVAREGALQNMEHFYCNVNCSVWLIECVYEDIVQ